jgi:3-hydroxyacyl-[acyl-carrier-protein] dehydratase
MKALTQLDLQAIFAYLPHRYPFLLVDKVLNILPHETITALKNVTINEPFFQGHFPGKPVMPGVLILEAMAQTTGILGVYSRQIENTTAQSLYLLAAMERVKFKTPVLPGDQLHIEATRLWERSAFLKCHVLAKVNDKIVCQADITGMHQSNAQPL